jgi:hypothetical protein
VHTKAVIDANLDLMGNGAIMDELTMRLKAEQRRQLWRNFHFLVTGISENSKNRDFIKNVIRN